MVQFLVQFLNFILFSTGSSIFPPVQRHDGSQVSPDREKIQSQFDQLIRSDFHFHEKKSSRDHAHYTWASRQILPKGMVTKLIVSHAAMVFICCYLISTSF